MVIGGSVVSGRAIFRKRTKRVGVGIGVADCKPFRVLLAFTKRLNFVLCSSRSLRSFEQDVSLAKRIPRVMCQLFTQAPFLEKRSPFALSVHFMFAKGDIFKLVLTLALIRPAAKIVIINPPM